MASLNCVKPSLDQSLENLLFPLGHGAGETPHRFQRIAGDRVFLDAQLLHQLGQIIMRNNHADRAGPGGRFGEDRVRLIAHAHRYVIAAAGGEPPHADDDG